MRSASPACGDRDRLVIFIWHGACSNGSSAAAGGLYEPVRRDLDRREGFMETTTPTPPDHRDLLAGSLTIGTMLLVSGSAKIGYGVWALGIAASACLLYRAGKYVVARAGMLLRSAPADAFRRLRDAKDGRERVAATPAVP
jgi:hypothetical protein